MYPCIFSGGDTAPDVSLGLVHVQHLLDLQVQRPVKRGSRSEMSLWTVDLLMPNLAAAARTVVRFSMM